MWHRFNRTVPSMKGVRMDIHHLANQANPQTGNRTDSSGVA